MTTDQLITVLVGFVAAIIGATVTIGAYVHGYLNIERIERRKQKIDLVQELMASRYSLNAAYAASDVDVRDINRALSRIAYVFSDNQNVIQSIDKFFASKSDDNLYDLLDQTLGAAGLKQYAVSRSHLSRVITISRRAAP